MIVYVAGRTSDYKRVRDVQNTLIDEGHVISYDWTRAAPDHVWDQSTAMIDTEIYDDNYLRDQAGLDMDGATAADVLVLVAGKGMIGSYIEVGAALAVGNPVFIFGKPERDSVFFHLDLVKEFDDISKLLDAVNSYGDSVEYAESQMDAMIEERKWRDN